MKQSPDFLLREVAGKMVLVPFGSAARRFPGMVTVNATGKYIWQLLKTEQTMQTLVAAVTQRYEVDINQAQTDTDAFLQKLKAVGAVTE